MNSANVFAIAQRNAEEFAPGFTEWLIENAHVWNRFCWEADRLRQRGRGHYSARTIVEVIRHETAIAENGGDFKINNNIAPDLARLYMLADPRANGFFETRKLGRK